MNLLLLMMALAFGAVAAFVFGRYLAGVLVLQIRAFKRRRSADGVLPEGANSGAAALFLTLLLALARGAARESDTSRAHTRGLGSWNLGSPKGRRVQTGKARAFAGNGGTSMGKVLLQAGVPKALNVGTLKAVRVRFGTIVGAASALICLSVSPLLACLALAAGLVAGWMLPLTWLRGLASRRRGLCTSEVPTMVDILSLSLKAGMSFDAALASYVEGADTLLAREFQGAYEAYMHGAVSREMALEGLADKWGGMVAQFVEVVLQALRFGAPLGGALGNLADQGRREHVAVVSTRIEKAPVKMLMPMGLLILPAMMLLVMGPAVLNMMEGFA